MKTVRVHYVAMLKEKTGIAEEAVQTEAGTVDALYAELRERHGFPWPAEAMRPGVNDAIVTWSADIQDGDTVIFLPPPSGG